MKIEETVAGKKVVINLDEDVIQRLNSTCFHAQIIPQAGNFDKWKSVQEFFADKTIMKYFLEDVVEDAVRLNTKSNSVCINYDGQLIGWSDTEKKRKFQKEHLVRTSLNANGFGLTIKKGLVPRLAPLTNLATIVYDMSVVSDTVFIQIISVYPGFDVGDIKGDVTRREGRIFFPPNYPGWTGQRILGVGVTPKAPPMFLTEN